MFPTSMSECKNQFMTDEKKGGARLQQRHRESVVGEGGEVLDQTTDTYLVETEKEFFLFYCKAISLFKDLKLVEIKLLAWMLGSCGFNSNRVVITSGVKEAISKEMGIDTQSISNALPKLVKANVLYRDNNGRRDGVYYIHPEYFWKGDISERNKKLKYVLELTYEKK